MIHNIYIIDKYRYILHSLQVTFLSYPNTSIFKTKCFLKNSAFLLFKIINFEIDDTYI